MLGQGCFFQFVSGRDLYAFKKPNELCSYKKARFILKEMQIRNENIVQRTETKHSIKTNGKHSTLHLKPLQNENVRKMELHTIGKIHIKHI